MCCCCPNLHRHQIHLISYGCVSFGLITTGLVFTVFAIFQKDSQIGKVWLAGPTTMVVGLVLCGKVIIDWGPAMLHAREGSIDSRLMEQINNPLSQMTVPLRAGGQIHYDHEPKCNGGAVMTVGGSTAGSRSESTSALHIGGVKTAGVPSFARPREPEPYQDVHPCLIYSQYDSQLNNVNGVHSLNRPSTSATRSSRLSPRLSSSTTLASPAHSAINICDCSQYGSTRRSAATFQGESFILNERNYLI